MRREELAKRLSLIDYAAAGRTHGLVLVLSTAPRHDLPRSSSDGVPRASMSVLADVEAIRIGFIEWRRATGLSPTSLAHAFEIGAKAVLSIERMKAAVTATSVERHARRFGLWLTFVPVGEAARVRTETLAAAVSSGPTLGADFERRKAVALPPGERHEIAELDPALGQLRSAARGFAVSALADASGVSLGSLLDRATQRVTPTGRMATLAAVTSALGCSIDIVSSDTPQQGHVADFAPASLGDPVANGERASAMLETITEELRENFTRRRRAGELVEVDFQYDTDLTVFPGTRVTTVLHWLHVLGLKLAIRPAGMLIDWSVACAADRVAPLELEAASVDRTETSASACGSFELTEAVAARPAAAPNEAVMAETDGAFQGGIEAELHRLRNRLDEVAQARRELGSARDTVERKLSGIASLRRALSS